MTDHGDDCYFYYYSTCTKGDSCPFRHCEAAMGNETVCNLWQEGRCFRMPCKLRHMEIQKNRKEIPCYWENQPAGCQKAHCVFYHEKQRFIDGIFVPQSKVPKTEEPQHEEPAPPPAPLPAAANPQLRGVLKAETQETVPSPTHPPVVINPADDDEDEDDQFSEEGEDGKFGPDGTRLTSPRKLAGASIPTLNFGVSTLEEIRLRKALKASMKKAGYPVQSADASHPKANRENIRSRIHPVGFQVKEEPVYCGEMERKPDIIDRLGKRMLNKDATDAGHLLLKRSLADRLGRVVEDEEHVGPHLRNGVKSIKARLGFQADDEAPSWPVQKPENMSESSEAPQQIRIKTLEEIRQEKASKSQNKKEHVAASAPGATTARTLSTKDPKGAKRQIVDSSSVLEAKTFPPVRAKKKRVEDQPKPDTAAGPCRASQAPERATAKAPGPPDARAPARSSHPGAHLRVKTLEEIRREKAARLQAQHAKEAEDTKSPAAGAGEDAAKKPGLIRIKKPQVPSTANSSAPSSTIQPKKNPEAKEKLVASTASGAEANAASSNGVKVKTFEEIMREKRLRKQEMEEEQASSSPGRAATEPPQKRAAAPCIKKTAPVRSQDVPPAATSPPSAAAQSSEGLSATRSPPVRKRISLKSKAVSPSLHGPGTAHTASESTSSPPPPPPPPLLQQQQQQQQQAAPADSESQSPDANSTASPQGPNGCPAPTPIKQTKKMASQDKSPGQTEIKVRPKLNVKPSVMKPAVQVKPGHKRKLAVRSAVAEVKPLNSSSTVPEEPPLEQQRKRTEISPANDETQPSPAATQSPASRLCSPAKEASPPVPIYQHSPVQNLPDTIKANNAPASRDACTVLQSPAAKTPSHVKPRRPSVAAPRVPSSSGVSAVDDFDELMNEFTDDHLGDEMDPGMGEDDLLQELSEMIDS